MEYQGTIYRPPSEADALIIQATVGCSWNACTYCAMYRDREFSVRPVSESLAAIERARRTIGGHVEKVFIADGDALVMPLSHWEPILAACREAFPRLRRVSAYATARNLNDKSSDELKRLRAAGLSLLYLGPESGDDVTLKRIAKGAGFAAHVEAAQRAKDAEFALSTIFLLGVAGIERSTIHAEKSGALITAMDPEFVALLTLTIVPHTPIARLIDKGRFSLPDISFFLREIRDIVAAAEPTDALLRTNHASNYLPLGGRLPRDRQRIVERVDAALAGEVSLRPEWSRGL